MMTPGEEPAVRVLLVDDHPALRMGLRLLLDREPDISVVGEADGGEAALRMGEALLPHVVVLDCQLPDLDGVQVARAWRAGGVPLQVVALSAYDDDALLTGMHAAGARGYLLKNEAPGCIVAAVRAAVRGESFWTPEQEARIERWQIEVTRIRESLTEREEEVLRLIAEGLSNRAIALQLEITPRTADFHASNIFRKLGVASRVEAALWARAYGRQ